MWALDEFVSEQFSVFRRPKGLAGRNNVYPRFGWPVEPWNCSARDAGGEVSESGTRWKESVTTSERGKKKKREESGWCGRGARGRAGGDGDTFFGCNFLSAPATKRFDQSLNHPPPPPSQQPRI